MAEKLTTCACMEDPEPQLLRHFFVHLPLRLQVEVIMVERDAAGQSAGQFSVGWAQLPLFADGTRPALGSQAAAAPVLTGTPRYLLFRWEPLQHQCVAEGKRNRPQHCMWLCLEACA